jgi:hypothetical protein
LNPPSLCGGLASSIPIGGLFCDVAAALVLRGGPSFL